MKKILIIIAIITTVILLLVGFSCKKKSDHSLTLYNPTEIIKGEDYKIFEFNDKDKLLAISMNDPEDLRAYKWFFYKSEKPLICS